MLMSENGPSGSLFCAFCGKAMGVYEPLVAIGGEHNGRRTSRLQHRENPVDGVLVHEECFAKQQPWSGEATG